MPKIKMPKNSPSLDMTPMVDLAFLLVTFFMLTASFRAAEPVVVDTPSSISEKMLPDNYMMVSIDKEGRPFFTVTNAAVRRNTLEEIGGKYGIKFTEDEIKRFGVMSTFGVPIANLKAYINATESQRNAMPSAGIPMDSTDNQLDQWVLIAYKNYQIDLQMKKNEAEAKKETFDSKKLAIKFAIKADSEAPYVKVKKIIDIFTNREIYQFNMITTMEERK